MQHSDIDRDTLRSEFTELLNQQLEALERETYVGMDAADKEQYESRARRIMDIEDKLGIAPSPHRHGPDW